MISLRRSQLIFVVLRISAQLLKNSPNKLAFTHGPNTTGTSMFSDFFFYFFVGSFPIMFLQVAQASYNNNEKPDQSAVLG